MSFQQHPVFSSVGAPIRRCLMVLLALSTVWLSACASNPVTGKKDFVMMSEEEELALGRNMHPKVMKAYPRYDDEELQAYVSKIGEELSLNSHRSGIEFRFTVVDSPAVNAFALPGGYIYITRGIMSYMNSEAELAGVLGHEIGHVTARHGVRQQSKAQATGIFGAIVGAAYGGSAGQFGSLLSTAVVRGYGRSYELEADRLGAEYLARNGYDPDDMLEVVGILKDQEDFERQRAAEEKREPNAYHGLFASHPRNDKRLQEVIEAAKQYQTANGARGKSREAFLRRFDNMVYGQGENEGVLRAGRFYHKKLDFTVQFPQAWRVENLSDRLVATAPNQEEILQVMVQDRNRRQPPRDYLVSRFRDLKNGEGFNTEAGPGYVGTTTQRTPWGRRPTEVAVVFHNKKIYQFGGASKNSYPGPEFLETVKSFRPLRDNEKELAEARRIKVVKVKPGDTIASLAADSGITNYAEEQLRLLNGLYPDGEPQVGQLIKVVE